jgi:Tfp pilus assembly protein PilF
MSLIHFKAGRFKAADESVRKAISLNPRSASNWYQLGRMCYLQGDYAAASKFAAKALELAPRDPDITNLVIMSETWDQSNIDEILARYHKSLELDPTNAGIHENIGFCHLHYTGNYKAAEEAFRRSLFFEPACKSARSNLFATLKKRDPIYRALHAPRDFLVGDFSFIIPKNCECSDSSLLGLYLWLVPNSVRGLRYVGVGLWGIFVWPLVKAYEYLTIGDILSKAGEVGAKSGGIGGYRRWSLRVRLGIFAFFLAAFWGGAGLFWVKRYAPSTKHPGVTLLGFCIAFGLIAYLVYKVRGVMRKVRERRVESHVRRRAEIFGTLLEPEPETEEAEPAPVRFRPDWADFP